MKQLAIFALATVLLLAGCAATPQSQPTATATPAKDYLAPPSGEGSTAEPQPEPSGPGTYFVGINQAKVTLQIPPAEQPDAETLAMLAAVGVTPGSWILADIDNRAGSQSTPVHTVGVSTADGKRVEYTALNWVANDVPTSGMDADLQRRFVTWSNGLQGGAKAGERVQGWLMSAEPLPADFVRVDATPGAATEPVKAAKQ